MRKIIPLTWLAAVALFLCCAMVRQVQAEPSRPAKAAQSRQEQAAGKTPRVTGAKVLAVGLFTSTLESREISLHVADSNRDQARDFTLVKRGAAVEARLDTGIGLRYQLTGEPKGGEVVVDVVVRHPAMVNPNTQLPMTHSTAQYTRSIGAVEHNVWNFDTPSGLVPGAYVIEVLHKGRVLARQAFQVTVKQ